MSLFFIIPIYSGISGGLLITFLYFYLTKTNKGKNILENTIQQMVPESEVSDFIQSQLDNDLFDAEMEGVIDRKLDDLVLVFKRQIPMASSFLVGPLVEKLKENAKNEILKIIPEMKQRVNSRMSKEFHGGKFVEKIFKNIQLSCFCDLFVSIFIVAIAVGTCFGLFQVALMYLFGYIL